MFCPECQTEYEPWVKECADCLVPLVAALPREEHVASSETVTVFATGNPALLAMAKSILEEAAIIYFAKGEGLQNLFAAGSIGGYNPALGPVEIQVGAEHASEARELLRALEGNENPELDDEENDD